MRRKELWAVLVVVVGAAAILLYIAAHAIGQILVLKDVNEASASEFSDVDTSTWQVYENSAFGFSFSYPSNWQVVAGNNSSDGALVVLGNPLNGTTTYAVDISVENNSSSLSAGEYVHQLLAADKAEDAANIKNDNGSAPSLAPQFRKSYLTSIAGEQAYELYDVFEFDHDAERIYVADGMNMLTFDFPSADVDPNIASPANNNAIVHLILRTLTLQ